MHALMNVVVQGHVAYRLLRHIANTTSSYPGWSSLRITFLTVSKQRSTPYWRERSSVGLTRSEVLNHF